MRTQGRKQYTPPPWRPPCLFFFRGLRLYGVYPSFRTYGVYPFPLFSQENSIRHSFFCSVTSGSGDRPRKEGSRGGGVCSFFPWNLHGITLPPPTKILRKQFAHNILMLLMGGILAEVLSHQELFNVFGACRDHRFGRLPC